MTFGSVRERGMLAPLFQVAAAASRSDLDHHVVEVGLRPQQHGRVGVDQLHVLGLDVHADDGVAVFEVDRGDLADLDAGDVDRLALPGRDRLGGGELGGDVVEAFADEGDPGRQRGLLLDEDAEHHHDAEQRQHRDRDRVLAAPAGLAGQRVAEVPAAAHLGFMLGHGLTAAGLGAPAWPMPALRSGTGLVEQRTSGFSGGRPPS